MWTDMDIWNQYKQKTENDTEIWNRKTKYVKIFYKMSYNKHNGYLADSHIGQNRAHSGLEKSCYFFKWVKGSDGNSMAKAIALSNISDE